MKLKVKTPASGNGDGEPKKVKLKGKKLPTQYGMYSGNVDEKGKSIDNPSEGEAMDTMVKYMKNNMPPQADNPSNVYRPRFSHVGVNYNRKKPQDNA